MRRLWLWSWDTRRHSTWPCLRGSSDRLSVSVQMDCELRDGLEILSEEPLTARGPGLAVGCNGHPVLPVVSCFTRVPRSKTNCPSHSTPSYGRHECGTPEGETCYGPGRAGQRSPLHPFSPEKQKPPLSLLSGISLNHSQKEVLMATTFLSLARSSHLPSKLSDSPGSPLHLPSDPPAPHPTLTTFADHLWWQ